MNFIPPAGIHQFRMGEEQLEIENPQTRPKCPLLDEKMRGCYITVATLMVMVILLAVGLATSIIRGARRRTTVPQDQEYYNAKYKAISSNVSVCLSVECVEEAAEILKRIDTSVHPCEDFYSFACGSFVKETKIPDEKSSVTMFSLASYHLKEKLRILIEENITDSDSAATVKAKMLYASCMDLDLLEETGLEPLEEILEEMGGWPVVEGEDWNGGNYSWIDSIVTQRKFGFSVNSMFIFDVDNDFLNSSQRMIWLDQPILTLPRDYFIKGLNSSDVQAYLKYTMDLAVLLGANSTDAEEEMTDVLEFIIRMSEMSMPRVERRNLQNIHNVMNIKELQRISPGVPWVEVINIILPESLEVDEAEPVNIGDMNYFKNLTKLLQNTPNRVIANYMIMKVVMQSASFLSENIRLLDFKFARSFSGRTLQLPRWEECISMVSRSMAYAVSNLYVKNFFPKNAKGEVEELVTYLRNNFQEMLEGVQWMDSKTKEEAMKKEKAINAYIAYPEELLKDDTIEKYYENVTIGENLLENNLGIAVYHSDKYYEELRMPVDKNDWKDRGAITQVNAFYNSAENSIELPAGILQGVFYQSKRPNYLNFGGIGFVIGHEITHGFDDQGKQYDMNGNVNNWWHPETEEQFLRKTNCIIEQYSNFSSNKIQINGIYTQGENIADNGGIRVAYRAYQQWVEDIEEEEELLPGLPYTPSQMFWIASAQIWCSVYRPELLRNKIISDNHSPENFRVNGPLSNFEKFAEDWNCPAGSKMNTGQRCVVW